MWKYLLLAVALQSGFVGYADAQDWNPPFEIDRESTRYPLPQGVAFVEYDSAFVLVKAWFHERESRIDRFDILRVHISAGDSVAYRYMNDAALAARQEVPVSRDEYPELVRRLYDYLRPRLAALELKPTKYAQKGYRSRPVVFPVHLGRD